MADIENYSKIIGSTSLNYDPYNVVEELISKRTG